MKKVLILVEGQTEEKFIKELLAPLRTNLMNKVTEPTFSIVTSLYNSSPYIDEFYARIKKAVESITDRYEIIFVNDGSPDNSLEKAIAIQQQDSKVSVIDLSRNNHL